MADNDTKYRVVCSRDYYDGTYYIDIIPAKWAIHQIILCARQDRNHRAQDVAGAIFLCDNPYQSEPKVEFLAKKSRHLMSEYWRYDESIFPEIEKMIKEKFAGMKEKGIITTISRYDLDDYYGTKVPEKKVDYPKSIAEERMFLNAERHLGLKKIEQDKKIRDSKDHIDPVLKLRWNQYKDCER